MPNGGARDTPQSYGLCNMMNDSWKETRKDLKYLKGCVKNCGQGEDLGLALVAHYEKLMWDSEEVPTQCYDKDAFFCMEAETNNATYGPACLRIWGAFIVTGILFVFSMPIALWFTKCGSSDNLPIVPFWLYVCCAPVIAYLLFIESNARKFTMVTQLINIREGLAIFGYKGLSFKKWIYLSTTISFASHADLITNGFFTARSIVVESCEDNRINVTWQWMRSQTDYGVPFMGMSLKMWALLGWGLMFFQFVYSMGFVMISNVRGVARKADMSMHFNLIKDRSQNDFPAYDTCFASNCDVATSTIALAETTRMKTITSNEALSLIELSKKGRRCSYAVNAGSEFHRRFWKFLFFSIFQAAYQLNLQATTFGIAKAAADNHRLARVAFIETVASLGFGFLMAMVDLQQSIQDNRIDRKMVLEVCANRDTYFEKDAIHQKMDIERLKAPKGGGPSEYDVIMQKINQSERSVHRVFPAMCFLWIVYSFLVSAALIRTIMISLCPSGLFSFQLECIPLHSTLDS